MPVEIIMPKVDMDMTSGKVMVWHVEEGAFVEKGNPLFDIETDKAAMEVEAEAQGFVHHRVDTGRDIAIGQAVAWLYGKEEMVGSPPNVKETSAVTIPEVEATREPALEVQSSADSERRRATPSARRAARDAGLDIEQISGSGPRGRVQQSDVTTLLERPVVSGGTRPARFKPEAGKLAVTRRGSKGIPLVMIHGFASDALSWAVLEPYLADRETIGIDLPCHGKSPLRHVRDFAALSKELRETIDEMDLKAFDLVGHSLGGALALSLADIRPRKLRKLTLLAPAGLGPEINGTVLAGLCKASRPESLAPWLKTLVADETIVTDAFVRLAHAARSAGMHEAQTAMADTLFPDGVQAFDLRSALTRVSVPTRIVWGKRDRIVPWKHALHAPGPVALHLFEKLGHVLHLEAPDAIGAMLAEPL